MQVKRLTLAAGAETAFEFDSFFSRSIIVKNMTGGAIQFCDGPFDAAKAAIIPAFGWQTFTVTVPYDAAPKFYVKADVAGDVEIDFGSDGMGFTSNTFDLAGMIPHTLTLTQGDNTTLAVTLTRLHGETLDLDTPVSMTSGATVFNGDVILITPSASAGNYAKIKINGIDYGWLAAGLTLTISGETVIEAEAVALVEKTLTLTPGENTTLSAEAIRLPGMLVDLVTPIPIATAGKIYVGEIVQFTATTTAGTGYHVTLTINDDPVEVDENGKIEVTIVDDTTAVSASVADEGE